MRINRILLESVGGCDKYITLTSKHTELILNGVLSFVVSNEATKEKVIGHLRLKYLSEICIASFIDTEHIQSSVTNLFSSLFIYLFMYNSSYRSVYKALLYILNRSDFKFQIRMSVIRARYPA